MNNQKPMDIVQAGLANRYKKENRFKLIGLSAIAFSLMFLVFLFSSIFLNGYKAFYQTQLQIDVFFDPVVLDIKDPASANFDALVKKSLRTTFPDVKKRKEKKKLYGLVSTDGAYQLRDMVLVDPTLVGQSQRGINQ